jgi:hypothetical protein
MRKARCGNPDLGTYNSIRHPVNIDIPESLSKNIQGRSGKIETSEHVNIWPKRNLKWFIEEYPELQKYITSNDHIRRIFNQSFSDWGKHSGLKFEMAKSKQTADLKIRFHPKDHGDGYPFDGPGATLAHAFYPTSGDIHFDDEENFTDNYENDYEQYTLRLVAAHEIGHALGLSHVFEEDSLMYPVYQQFNSSYHISNNDQERIQKFYGKPTIEQPKTTSSPPITPKYSSDILPMDNWCSGEFQTGCEGPDGELYLFKDNQVWRYQARKKHSWDPQPTLISERFPSLTDATITACVKSSIGYTYLFRDDRMWKLKTHWSIDGPHILRGTHYPQNPHIALLHQNSIYLVRNRLIYRLNEFNYDRELEIRTIDSILNPPPDESIRSGFTYSKRHYIFTKNFVYVYDSTYGGLLPGYPRTITNGWFACESASQAAKSKNKITTTMRTLPTKFYQKHHDDEDDDNGHFHHHHHHHHPHRPRRPWVHRHHHHRPHEYRRRWED